MKKLLSSLATILILMVNSYSQGGVYIASGSNLFIGTGATVSLDSLVLRPTSNFNLTGLRREYHNAAVVHALSRPYIKRVFHFSATMPNYSGVISIYYRDAELNGIAEAVLTLNVHNGTNWNAYNSGVTRNSTSNVVTTTGLSSVPLNELTLASNTTALLTMNKAGIEPEEVSEIAVYPNPVVDVTIVRIASPTNCKAIMQVYDATGELLSTRQVSLSKGLNQVLVDLSGYAKGSYTLSVDWSRTNKTINIVKQ